MVPVIQRMTVELDYLSLGDLSPLIIDYGFIPLLLLLKESRCWYRYIGELISLLGIATNLRVLREFSLLFELIDEFISDIWKLRSSFGALLLLPPCPFSRICSKFLLKSLISSSYGSEPSTMKQMIFG